LIGRVGAGAIDLLEGLGEASAILSDSFEVLAANRLAKSLWGADLSGCQLPEKVSNRDVSITFLRRCLGSGSPMVGTLFLTTRGDSQRLQCRGNRVSLGGEAVILLRMSLGDEARFVALTRKAHELTLEIAQRRHAEAVLQESLKERDILMRELQHRVKNNMQMLSGMLAAASRDATTPDAKGALQEAANRFGAVSAVQQLLYASESSATVRSEPLLQSLIKGASALAVPTPQFSAELEDMDLPVEAATPIALIANELLVNAIKYGRPAIGPQRLEVRFVRLGADCRLEVNDNGPGFAPVATPRRASGVGLVRGLLRQLGGRLEVDFGGGARCSAVFPAPSSGSERPLGD
jgi:two-component sensor histidine kinase